MEVRPDLCGKCSGVLDWHHDPDSDSGKCGDCGEIWYPFDTDDLPTEEVKAENEAEEREEMEAEKKTEEKEMPMDCFSDRDVHEEEPKVCKWCGDDEGDFNGLCDYHAGISDETQETQ